MDVPYSGLHLYGIPSNSCGIDFALYEAGAAHYFGTTLPMQSDPRSLSVTSTPGKKGAYPGNEVKGEEKEGKEKKKRDQRRQVPNRLVRLRAAEAR